MTARVFPRLDELLEGQDGSRGDFGGARRRCLRDGGPPADGEQNPLVTGERDLMKDRCCHKPPRRSCAPGATEVQSSREESQSRYGRIKRAHLP
jgi:hypothetical protein